MTKYSVAVVGCGSIGALKADEYDRPGGDDILTLAHAFSAHPATDLVAFVDPSDNGPLAMQKWGVRHYYTCVEAMIGFKEVRPDIIVVATPTETHRDVLIQVLALKPRLVVAEKPFCSSLKEAQEVVNAYDKAGIPILVDYIRRFDPVGAPILNDLRAGNHGRIYHARCLYGRGLRRDGCHGLDVFNWVLGRPVGLQVLHDGRIDDAPERGDASHHVILTYEKNGRPVTAQMVPADSRSWGAFELEFITDLGVVSFPQWGRRASIRRAEAETTFGQYKALGWPPELVATALNKALLYLADNCVRYLRDAEPLICTDADALRVHEILDHVK